MPNSTYLIISAPSGAGKTTLINRLLSEYKEYEFSISSTTRSVRNGEIDGKDYYFISQEEFKKQILYNDFIEWAEVHGNYYGTSKKEIDRIEQAGKIPIFDLDVQGVRIIKEKLPGAVFIFIVPPSIDVLAERLKGRRTDSEEQINLRLKNAIEELKQYKLFDYIVVNDKLEEAIKELNSIVVAEKCKIDHSKDTVNRILEELKL